MNDKSSESYLLQPFLLALSKNEVSYLIKHYRSGSKYIDDRHAPVFFHIRDIINDLPDREKYLKEVETHFSAFIFDPGAAANFMMVAVAEYFSKNEPA